MEKCVKGLKNEIKQVENYLQNNIKLIVIIIFFGLLSYGFSLCNFTIGVDTEYAIANHGSNSSDWIGQGRFGIGILKLIFSTNAILPFRNTYLAVVLMIVNTILLCYALNSKDKNKNSILSIIMSVLYITSPIYVHNLYFTTYNFEIQVGILLSILAFYMSSKYILDGIKNKALILSSILITGFCIGIYESFISFIFSLICYKIIDYLIELKREEKVVKFKEFLGIIVKYAFIMIASVIVYYIADKVFTSFVPDDAYTDYFIAWNKQGVDVIIRDVLRYIKALLIDNRIVGTGIIFLTCIISSALILYYAIFKKSLRIYIPLLITAIMVSPFILTIALGSAMPFRTQQALILVAPLIFGILYKTINNKYFRGAILTIAILVGFYQTMNTNKLLYSDYARYQQDVDLTRQIANKITELGYTQQEKYKVVCIGQNETNLAPNIINQDVIGCSIYAWNYGNPSRIRAFMVDHGNNYMSISKQDIEKAKKYSSNMPNWPNEGSIKLIDNNIIVVKLSEPFK